jgi:hypothetical protein
MNRRMKISFVFIQSLLLLLVAFASTAEAQQGRRLTADTGLITLGPDQFLRVALTGDFNGDGDVSGVDYVFRRIGYIEQGNVYRVASQATTPRMRLNEGEAASIDISQAGFNAVRCIVAGNFIGTDASRARVTVQIINRNTNQVDSILIALLLP